MSDRTIAALFDEFETAAAAVRHLERNGPRQIEVSIIANNQDERSSQAMTRLANSSDDKDDVGTTVGAILGGSAGLLAGLALMLLPGVGPVLGAGAVLTPLIGGGAGAAFGALAGSLVDAGIGVDWAKAYEEGVRRGGTLVVVRTSEDNVEEVVQLLDQAGAIDMDERIAVWRGMGWTGAPAEERSRERGPE
ncbi:DUF1269 domain-containing protein [Microvirga mediterraneensis]|uniref:DUF1269 domain-containing protein n=1 Tax=Microvirga mediterraneensis TaxID=2754695 RepID=A0A838BWN0_9HYPH|nr:DUF1269 domain-containing protein [Microvirga mediterraneensis]MBA1159313.1 DUF1269 domain-containing protein [Microvirga mediterraneensis]